MTAKSFSLLGLKETETTNRFPQAWKKGESFGNHFYPLMKQLLVDVHFNKALRQEKAFLRKPFRRESSFLSS
jgi:hypothetical protein